RNAPTAPKWICRRRRRSRSRTDLTGHHAVALFQAFDHFGNNPVADSGLDLPWLWAIRSKWQDIDCALNPLLRTTAAPRSGTPCSTRDRFSCLHWRGIQRTIAQCRVLDLQDVVLVCNDN